MVKRRSYESQRSKIRKKGRTNRKIKRKTKEKRSRGGRSVCERHAARRRRDERRVTTKRITKTKGEERKRRRRERRTKKEDVNINITVRLEPVRSDLRKRRNLWKIGEKSEAEKGSTEPLQENKESTVIRDDAKEISTEKKSDTPSKESHKSNRNQNPNTGDKSGDEHKKFKRPDSYFSRRNEKTKKFKENPTKNVILGSDTSKNLYKKEKEDSVRMEVPKEEKKENMTPFAMTTLPESKEEEKKKTSATSFETVAEAVKNSPRKTSRGFKSQETQDPEKEGASKTGKMKSDGIRTESLDHGTKPLSLSENTPSGTKHSGEPESSSGTNLCPKKLCAKGPRCKTDNKSAFAEDCDVCSHKMNGNNKSNSSTQKKSSGLENENLFGTPKTKMRKK